MPRACQQARFPRDLHSLSIQPDKPPTTTPSLRPWLALTPDDHLHSHYGNVKIQPTFSIRFALFSTQPQWHRLRPVAYRLHPKTVLSQSASYQPRKTPQDRPSCPTKQIQSCKSCSPTTSISHREAINRNKKEEVYKHQVVVLNVALVRIESFEG